MAFAYAYSSEAALDERLVVAALPVIAPLSSRALITGAVSVLFVSVTVSPAPMPLLLSISHSVASELTL